MTSETKHASSPKTPFIAFLSYRHADPDRAWASWLVRRIESYRVPRHLGLGRRRLGKVFRDDDELGASSDLSAAIVDVLCAKLFAAAERERVSQVVVCGGVAANSMLRARVTQEAERRGMELFIPAIAFCTDNAAMIGAAGQALLDRQGPSPLSVNAFASLVKGIAP